MQPGPVADATVGIRRGDSNAGARQPRRSERGDEPLGLGSHAERHLLGELHRWLELDRDGELWWWSSGCRSTVVKAGGASVQREPVGAEPIKHIIGRERGEGAKRAHAEANEQPHERGDTLGIGGRATALGLIAEHPDRHRGEEFGGAPWRHDEHPSR